LSEKHAVLLSQKQLLLMLLSHKQILLMSVPEDVGPALMGCRRAFARRFPIDVCAPKVALKPDAAACYIQGIPT
jgi:hypothetical protein